MREVEYRLVDEASFDTIPAPAEPGARCQTCDYWERLDGGRESPEPPPSDGPARAGLKRSRLLGNRASGGALAMLAFRTDSVDRIVVGYAQFGPLSAYPRALTIRERYPELPESPPPWVITCLQVADADDPHERHAIGRRLLEGVCAELDSRGIIAVEAYPERHDDPWRPSPGPASAYAEAGFDHMAGDDRFPVYRRELSGETDADAWSDLLRVSRPEEDGDDWPLRLPPTRPEEDFFRLPPEKPKRPNPFGED